MLVVIGTLAIVIGVARLLIRSPSRLQKAVATCCVLTGIAILIAFPPARKDLDVQREQHRALCRRIATKIDVLREYGARLPPLERHQEWNGFRDLASSLGEFCIEDVDSCDSYYTSPLFDRDFDRKAIELVAAFRSGTGCPR